MTEFTLAAPGEENTVALLAALFTAHSEAELAVREERCLSDWLAVGQINLQAATADAEFSAAELVGHAVRFGSYEWEFPKYSELLPTAAALLPAADAAARADGQNVMRRPLEHLAFAAARVGLVSPTIDPDLLRTLPFRRPTTLVVDTSAIIQGGLSFAVRFLCPAARVRVPAVAHMELLCQTDNYFKMRRSGVSEGSAKGLKRAQAARALHERACGVGGQRALLRVELHTDTEIERATIGPDPLRGIVRLDEEHKALQVEYVQRAFADRLIFETAREHQSRCAPGHPVMLMSADEGLARMTLGEGMRPFSFRPLLPDALSEQVLPGTAFNPFSGRLYGVPLADLLWELAVTFGAIRLRNGTHSIEVQATGENLPWRPFQATGDLLWVKSSSASPASNPHTVPTRSTSKLETSKGGRAGRSARQSVATAKPSARTAAYKLSVPRLLRLIGRLQTKRQASAREVSAFLGVESAAAVADYRKFLVAGEFCTSRDGDLAVTDVGDSLWAAILRTDPKAVGALLKRVPSFDLFVRNLEAAGNLRDVTDSGIAERAIPTYLALAEISGMAASIPEEGTFSTPRDPPPGEFVELALAAYRRLLRGEEYVLTGAWLEQLVREYGIHPVTARVRLEEARLARLLERYTEGLTPDTRYENHVLWILTRKEGVPSVERVHIYHGDFLIGGRASVSLRLQPRVHQ